MRVQDSVGNSFEKKEYLEYLKSFSHKINALDSGLIILKCNRDSSFVFRYEAINRSNHSFLSVDSHSYNNLEENIRKSLESFFQNIYFIDQDKISIIRNDCKDPIKHKNYELMISSGTSGNKKIVVWSKAKLNIHVNRINQVYKLNSKIPELIIMPLSHSFGLMRLRCAIHRKCAIYISKNIIDHKLVQKSFENKDLFIGGVVSGLEIFIEMYKKLIQKSKISIYLESGSMRMNSNLLRLVNEIEVTNKLSFKHHYGSSEFTRFSFIEKDDLDKHISTIITSNNNFDFKVLEGKLIINTDNWFDGYLSQSGKINIEDINKIENSSYLYTGDIVESIKGNINFLRREKETLNLLGLKFNAAHLEDKINKEFTNIKDILLIQKDRDDEYYAFISTNKIIQDSDLFKLSKILFIETSVKPKVFVVSKIFYTGSEKKVRNIDRYQDNIR
tara:strand:- start:11635 stop:12969 length:1335 start_codon:yes stop_codon:yes gene_type:complete